MDKYRRNDDTNDDLGVYNQDEPIYEHLTVVDNKGRASPHQRLRVFGRTEEETELLARVEKHKQGLSLRERELLSFVITKGFSLSAAARRMGISQPMASKYWKQIKEKMNNASL